ncbi:hypothetical protein ACN27F_15825 [Solwaraspora sp. WMMB335]|uniref:hypothetical protein n=1 Tax=Solwaraspora sp. WMMB335 TaxID=3404118 RepID=UPI003B937ED6
MRCRPVAPFRTSPAVLLCVAFITLSVAGCGSPDPVTDGSTPTPTSQASGTDPGAATPTAAVGTVPVDARMQLAAAAATASDLHATTLYTLSTTDRVDRTVTVVTATDGSWRVDIPGGALAGAVDIAMAGNADGLFQCRLASAQQPAAPSCVRLGDPDVDVDPAVDPRLQHLFTDWLSVLTDRRAPLAVSVADPLAGADGTCFSVESTTASLQPPLDVGIYCYRADGTLTAARLAVGGLVLAGTPGAAPQSITLPGPVTAGAAMRTGGPPAAPTSE